MHGSDEMRQGNQGYDDSYEIELKCEISATSSPSPNSQFALFSMIRCLIETFIGGISSPPASLNRNYYLNSGRHYPALEPLVVSPSKPVKAVCSLAVASFTSDRSPELSCWDG